MPQKSDTKKPGKLPSLIGIIIFIKLNSMESIVYIFLLPLDRTEYMQSPKS